MSIARRFSPPLLCCLLALAVVMGFCLRPCIAAGVSDEVQKELEDTKKQATDAGKKAGEEAGAKSGKKAALAVVEDAKTALEIDLAEPVLEINPIKAGTYKVTVANMAIYKYDYTFKCDLIETKRPALDFSDIERKALPGCKDKFKLGLLACDSETKVRTLINALEDPCKEDPGVIEEIAKTKAIAGNFMLKKGGKLVVTITRKQKGKTETDKTWTITYTAEPKPGWLTTYGFGFILNDQAANYFAKSDGAGKYIVTRRADEDNWKFAPLIQFAYPALPFGEGDDCSVGPVVGFGFDMSNPIVTLGLALNLWDNVTLQAGGVFYKRKGLNGQYRENEVIDTQATDLTEENYKPSFFLSIGISSNPFSSSSKK